MEEKVKEYFKIKDEINLKASEVIKEYCDIISDTNYYSLKKFNYDSLIFHKSCNLDGSYECNCCIKRVLPLSCLWDNSWKDELQQQVEEKALERKKQIEQDIKNKYKLKQLEDLAKELNYKIIKTN